MNDANDADQRSAAAPARQRRFSEIGRSFAHRNYRLFFFGQGVSLLGTWMQQTAATWLVYRLTDSPLLLGVTNFAGQFPVLILSPFAGVLGDRWNRRRILLCTQTLAMVQAFALFCLMISGTIEVWQVIGLSFVLGCINAFEMPTRQAFVTEMVDAREDLSNAIALNSSLVNVARLVGPSVAGILIGYAGEATCFFLNGLSFLAVIVALWQMRIRPQVRNRSPGSVWHGLQEGFVYAFGFAPVRAVLLLVGLMGLAGMPYMVLIPVFAQEFLHGGPKTYGFMVGAAGVGALAGSLYLAARTSVLGLGRLLALTPMTFGLGAIAFSFSRLTWLSMACLVLTGFSMMVQIAAGNTILQTIVDEEKRGRVMSFFAVAVLGMMPLGSLVVGSLAQWIDSPNTLRLGASVCIVGGLLFARQLPALRRIMRPIYRRMGILPAVAEGLHAAAEPTAPPKH